MTPYCVWVLQKEDAVLIDIRADEVRSAEGVVDLRLSAFGKGAAVPLRALKPAVARKYVP